MCVAEACKKGAEGQLQSSPAEYEKKKKKNLKWLFVKVALASCVISSHIQKAALVAPSGLSWRDII